MKLENLQSPAPNKKTRKRVGRGEGSGLGKQSGRGHKGQKAGSGYSHKTGFEGGQMPLQRRVPKFGFKNPFRIEYAAVNLDSIDALIQESKLSDTITVEDIYQSGLVRQGKLIKILGRGEVTKAVNITVHAFSKTAEEKITKAGGTITKIEK